MADQINLPQKTKFTTRIIAITRRMPISRRLFINAVVSVLSLIFIIALLAINASAIYADINQYINDTSIEIQLTNQISFSLQGIFSEVREYALLQQTSSLDEIETYLKVVNTDLFDLLGTGTGIESEAETQKEDKILQELQVGVQQLETKVENLTALIQATPEAEDEIKEAIEGLEDLEQTLVTLIQEINGNFEVEAQAISDNVIGRIATTVSVLVGGILLFFVFYLVTYRVMATSIIRPINYLVDISRQIADGATDLQAEDSSRDEIGVLANAFNRTNERQRELILAEAKLSTNLQRNLAQLQASSQVAQVITSILDPDEIIEQVVNLIQEAFDLYYVGLFMPDDLGEWAVLQAGVGEAGQAMLGRGHRIRISEGMIGWCISNEQARVARAVDEDTVHLAADELPDTRSEAAIPLRSRGQILGALTVQDTQVNRFDEDTVRTLQNMADQVAIALDNARLFAENRAALEASRRAYGQISQEAWKLFLGSRPDTHFLATPQKEVKLQPQEWSSEMTETYSIGQITHPDDQTVHIPIILRDQTLGIVRLRKRENRGGWADEEIELMDTLVDQLETSLETARLYSDTQLQAERERVTAEITNKLHRALDMEVLMQTMIKEISLALGAESAFIQLGTATPETDSAEG